MRRSLIAALAFLIVLGAVSTPASAFTCPFTGVQLPKDYAEVTMLPVVKYVDKTVTITIIDMGKDGSRQVASDRLILIYYIVDNESLSEYSIYTKSDGKAKFTPGDSGRYAVATSGRYIFFDAISVCSDGICSRDETRASCPKDCAKCGDSVCDVNENKETCPKDCIVCGDSSCDSGENRNNCPGDCARCGDGVCDINENKENCEEDCVVCGDNVCDAQEIISLHNTTCPADCALCGDGYCDQTENVTTCPGDCAVCGDGVCDGGENITCLQDCSVCGNGVCEKSELISLHETTCPGDCAVCGDGYCDSGESKTCNQDCAEKVQGLFIGYFAIPIALVIVIIIFEITRHYWADRGEDLKESEAEARKKKKMVRMEVLDVAPYLIIFAVSLAAAGALLALTGPSYSKNLAVLDLGSYLMGNALWISLAVVSLAVGIGLLARATYYMERNQAIRLSAVFGLIGMAPGLFIFLKLEYLALMGGMAVGIAVATMMIKREEAEYSIKKPFKIGAEAADKMLTVAALFVCLAVFLQLYLGGETEEKLSASIQNSDATRAYVRENFGMQNSTAAVRANVVEPFFESSENGMSGKLLFSTLVALLLLAVLKFFILITKLLAGFFSWLLDRSGFV